MENSQPNKAVPLWHYAVPVGLVLFLIYQGFSHHRAAEAACRAVNEMVGDGEGTEPFWRTDSIMPRGIVAHLRGRYINTALRENPVVAKALEECRRKGYPVD